MIEDIVQVPLKDISIPIAFLSRKVPRKLLSSKMNKYAATLQLGNITISDVDGRLTSGYENYLVAKAFNVETVPAVIVSGVKKSIAPIIVDGEIVRPVCYICGRELLRDFSTIDHVVPLAKGGSCDADNTKHACKRCNNLKGMFDFTPELVELIKRERDLYG